MYDVRITNYELRITNYELEIMRAGARGCGARALRNFGSNAACWLESGSGGEAYLRVTSYFLNYELFLITN